MKLVLEFSDPDRVRDLQAAYPGVQFVAAATVDDVIREIVDADVFFGWPTRETYLAAGKLRWIHSPSVGIEFIQNVPELVESEVILTNSRGTSSDTIAEHAFALLLGLTRAIPSFVRSKADHDWPAWTHRPPLRGIGGLTLGVVGFGNIGRAIAKRALGFGMKVLAVDAFPAPPPDGVKEVWTLDRLPDLLHAADIVAVAAPITPETRGMIGPAEIDLLKSGAYLIVVSRGGIVDEPALVSALRDGRLAGAGLDVTAVEPLPPDDPLWDVANLIVTPHCSGVSTQTDALVWSILHENVGRFVRGDPLRNVCDKRLGF
jgi:phosphoglycerate dehydrogenase-like enzyme